MSDPRRGNRRSFVPGIDGTAALESRLLLSGAKVAAAAHAKSVHVGIANSGKIARVTDVDGEKYAITITGQGFVRATPQSGGRVGLLLQSTNSETVVTVDPLLRQRLKNSAHDYPLNPSKGDRLLHIGSIKVQSGRIGQFLGYRTAELSGVFSALSESPVDRVAFYSYQPGALVRVGGDLNSIDSFTDMNFGGSGGIVTGRDLNWINVGGNINLQPGSNLAVGRDVGLTAQPAKGTASGGQGGRVTGNVIIAPGASFTIGRSLQATFLVDGNLNGFNQLVIPFGGSNFIVRGSATP